MNDATRGLITEDQIYSLPEGRVVVPMTRAGIVDMDAVRERVLNDETVLAADVWDQEPLSLHDPLLTRHDVIHTQQIAGRSRDAKRGPSC